MWIVLFLTLGGLGALAGEPDPPRVPRGAWQAWKKLTEGWEAGDTQTTLRLARRLGGQPAFPYHDDAAAVVAQLEADDGSLDLPLEAEWAELSSTMSREEQVSWLAARLVRLSCSAITDPGSVDFGDQWSCFRHDKGRLNPFRTLLQMELDPGELDPLLPYVFDDRLIPSWDAPRSFLLHLRRLMRVGEAAADLVNRVAALPLVRHDAWAFDPEQQAASLQAIRSWQEQSRGRSRTERQLANLDQTANIEVLLWNLAGLEEAEDCGADCRAQCISTIARRAEEPPTIPDYWPAETSADLAAWLYASAWPLPEEVAHWGEASDPVLRAWSVAFEIRDAPPLAATPQLGPEEIARMAPAWVGRTRMLRCDWLVRQPQAAEALAEAQLGKLKEEERLRCRLMGGAPGALEEALAWFAEELPDPAHRRSFARDAWSSGDAPPLGSPMETFEDWLRDQYRLAQQGQRTALPLPEAQMLLWVPDS